MTNDSLSPFSWLFRYYHRYLNFNFRRLLCGTFSLAATACKETPCLTKHQMILTCSDKPPLSYRSLWARQLILRAASVSSGGAAGSLGISCCYFTCGSVKFPATIITDRTSPISPHSFFTDSQRGHLVFEVRGRSRRRGLELQGPRHHVPPPERFQYSLVRMRVVGNEIIRDETKRKARSFPVAARIWIWSVASGGGSSNRLRKTCLPASARVAGTVTRSSLFIHRFSSSIML
jgi:hypothetical protein